MYGFAGGDPINAGDPMGLCPDPVTCLVILEEVAAEVGGVAQASAIATEHLAVAASAALVQAGMNSANQFLGQAVAAGESLIPTVHGNSLLTTKLTQGYTLRDRDTGAILKYGETTLGRARYTRGYLRDHNADLVFENSGTKREMHQWQHDEILNYKATHGGNRPPLNKSDW